MTAVADPGVVAGGRPRSGLLIAGWAAVLGTVLSFARAPLTGELDLPETTASPEAIVGFFQGSKSPSYTTAYQRSPLRAT